MTDDCPVILPGYILVGDDGLYGYLRMVTQVVSQTADQIVLETTSGILTDGIRKLDVDENLSLPLEIPDLPCRRACRWSATA